MESASNHWISARFFGLGYGDNCLFHIYLALWRISGITFAVRVFGLFYVNLNALPLARSFPNEQGLKTRFLDQSFVNHSASGGYPHEEDSL
jgi:hypothetical protein